MIRPQASSGAPGPDPPVPQTVTPRRLAAARSKDALRMPVVISSFSAGSWSSSAAGNGVRSRMATITSYGASRRASSPPSAMWSVKTVTSARPTMPDQSALLSATSW